MRNKIQFSKEIDNVIKTLVEEKKSINDITKILNEDHNFKCSRFPVVKRIEELGLDISQNKSRKPLIDEKELIAYIIDGFDVLQISKKLNVDPHTLQKYIINNNITYKVEHQKMLDQTWFGRSVVDLRIIRDELITEISKYLNCKLVRDKPIQIDNKKFIFDFYSEEYQIGFLCGIHNAKPDRKHAIARYTQWKWIQKLRETNPLMKIIHYYYLDAQSTAYQFNEIMKDPLCVDEEIERRNSHDNFFGPLESPVKSSVEQSSMTRIITKWEKQKNEEKRKLVEDPDFARLDLFKYENEPYDKEGFRFIDFNTLILNINPNTGAKLSEEEKKNLLDKVNTHMKEEYEFYLEDSKNETKIKLMGEDIWNYKCGRKLYWKMRELKLV